MAVQVRPSVLINPSGPPIQDMIDAVENRCAEFILSKGNLPTHLYVNAEFWNDALYNDLGPHGEPSGFVDTVHRYNLEVVTHPDIPYDMAGLYDQYLPAREVAMRLKDASFDLEEAIAKGLVGLG